MPRVSACLFCSSASSPTPAHVLGEHKQQCFECRACGQVASVSGEAMRAHLKSDHGIDPVIDRTKMMEAVRFPSDSRQVNYTQPMF